LAGRSSIPRETEGYLLSMIDGGVRLFRIQNY
jgi:hypothetical protein